MILTINRPATPPVAVQAISKVPNVQIQQSNSEVLPPTVPTILPINTSRKGEIRTVETIKMLGGEEAVIQAEIIYENGERSEQFAIANQSPLLLSIDDTKRIIRALQAGVATFEIFDPNNPHIRKAIQVTIEPSTIAIIDLEIVYQ